MSTLNPQQKLQRLALATVAAAALAIPAEGIYTRVYKDPVGISTYCVGATTGVQANKQYALAECMSKLSADMSEAVQMVDRCAPDAPLSVLIAFSDAVFNLGPKIACDTKNSTAARHLAAKEWRQACNELPKWDKGVVGGKLVPLPGLTKRRLAEKETCLKEA